MAKAKWFLDRIADVLVALIAGLLLYLIVGGYVAQPLNQVSPYLPTLLIVSIILAIIGVFLYRFVKSVMFHRFVESNYQDLFSYLKKWDDLNNACVLAIDERLNAQKIGDFETIRATLLYDYPKIKQAVKTQSYSRIDRMYRVAIHDYDVIGNLLATSPFTRMQYYNAEYEYRDFKENWDIGRTILISAIGLFDTIRINTLHSIYINLHLVPVPKELKKKS